MPEGSVYDVGVDIRKGSPFYGKWVGVELNEENNLMIYVPAGFAHGFLLLSESAEVAYKCTKEYSPEHDRGIIWNDPDIAVEWPVSEPVLSGKDSMHPRLKEADNNFIYDGSGGQCRVPGFKAGMKVLITGAMGQLAQEFQRTLPYQGIRCRFLPKGPGHYRSLLDPVCVERSTSRCRYQLCRLQQRGQG